MEDDSESRLIKKRLVMPTIGNISVGKSYFLNSLLGFEFCQVQNDITTKFVLFIRNIDNLKEPILYKLEPKKNKNNSYDFIKNKEIFKGEEKIKEKIKEINSSENDDENPIFYMLEVKIVSIENKEFLNNVDFLDIPGLNESGVNYIELYFKYIKDMIKYCLIIFNVENYNSRDTLDVIEKVKKYINVPMKNFLLILNKIDKVDGTIKETIRDFKKVFLNSEDFNIYDNSIIPMNSLELKSEIQIENNFYHFINYYFIEYNKLLNNNGLNSFLDYIKSKIKCIDKDKKNLLINEIQNFDENIYNDIIKPNITNLIEEKYTKGYSLIIDLENKSEIKILKMLYICFVKKLLKPKLSNNLNQINDYFNKIKDYNFPKEIINIENEENTIYNDKDKEHLLLKKLDDFFKNSFNSKKLKKYGSIVPLLNDDFKVLNNYILNSCLLFIPILGISNSGKSTFLNCLLQKEILTCNSAECTRRGIIIRYIEDKNKISLYSIKFKYIENLDYTYYYFIKNKKLSDDFNNIKEIIEISNDTFPKNEEKSFFLLETNIQLLDDMKIAPEIKTNICFIDFPGHNTHNNLFSDRGVYQNVIKMSSSFIYINNGKAFKEDSNKIILQNLVQNVLSCRIGDISPEQFLDLCLFIFNKADTLDKEEKNILGISDDVKEILGLPKDFKSNILCSLFSALLYKKFLAKKEEYEVKNIINNYYLKFENEQNKGIEIDDEDSELFDEDEFKIKNYLEYIKINLDKKIKSDFSEVPSFDIDKEKVISSEIYKNLFEQMEQFHKDKNIKKDSNYEKNIIDISKNLIYVKENIKKLKYFVDSYANDIFVNIEAKIIQSYKLKRKEFNNHLDRFFYFMNVFFRIENIFEKINAEVDYKKISKDILSNIEKIFKNYNGEKIFSEYKTQIIDFIKQKKKEYIYLMQENSDDINEVIDLINKKIIQQMDDFQKAIDEEILKLEEDIGKLMKGIGITETGIINKEIRYKKTLFDKIIIGIHYATFGIGTFVYEIARGLFYELPNWIINKFKDDQRKYNQFLDDEKDSIKRIMDSYLTSTKENIKKYKELTVKNAERFLGLSKAATIAADDFWKEAMNKYLEIYEEYKNMKLNAIF